jgi:hypothetical protein
MLYQVWLWWSFIDGFVISFCKVNFLHMLHSTWVFASLHSPSTNSSTCACGMQTISMDALFAPPCFTLGVHAKSMFENWDFVKFWTCIDYDLGIQPMLIKKCIYTTLFFHQTIITSGYPWWLDTIHPCLQACVAAFGSQDLSFRTSIFGSQDLGFRTSIIRARAYKSSLLHLALRTWVSGPQYLALRTWVSGPR